MLLTILKQLLFPLITDKILELISKTNLPFLTKLKYNALNASSEKILESIFVLADKIKSNPDSIKNEARLVGLKLALDIIDGLAIKLSSASSKIKKEFGLDCKIEIKISDEA